MPAAKPVDDNQIYPPPPALSPPVDHHVTSFRELMPKTAARTAAELPPGGLINYIQYKTSKLLEGRASILCLNHQSMGGSELKFNLNGMDYKFHNFPTNAVEENVKRETDRI